jgi:hypothetical protein
MAVLNERQPKCVERRDDYRCIHRFFLIQRQHEEKLMSLNDAIRAAEDNIANHASSNRDPALYNISIALLNIAKALKRLQSDVDDIHSRVK